MTIQTLFTNADDCWSNDGGGGFYNTLDNITIGNNSVNDFPVTAWLPFIVNLSKNQVIISATLKVVAVQADTSTIHVKFGCEAADNPPAPTTKEDLEARVQTAAYLSYDSNAAWVIGTEYTFDITSAVQEVLNRAGWTPQNTLAVLIKDNGTGADNVRAFAATENATYAEAILEIVFSSIGGLAVVAISPTLIF